MSCGYQAWLCELTSCKAGIVLQLCAAAVFVGLQGLSHCVALGYCVATLLVVHG